MPIRVPQVHLAYVPRHLGRRKRDIQPGGHALSIDLINVFYPHGHPGAFVGRLVSVRSKRGGIRPPAAPSLAAHAKKDLAFA